MIKHLILNNLVLVDTCSIDFGPGFNAVTGETGAGKTAFIEAVGLALGERADTALIRKGCDKAFIEVAFALETHAEIKELLEEAGIAFDDAEYLVIRREISKEGKNRAFINCRMAPLPLLQKIGALLIDRIGQHAHQALRTSDSQRALVDLFGSLASDLKDYQSAYATLRENQKRQGELQSLSAHREREIDSLRYQLEEITAVGLKPNEEEEVFERYQKLAHAQELTEKLDLMIKMLSESSSAVLPQVSRCVKTCETLAGYDKSLTEVSALLHESHIALTEAVRTLQSASQSVDSNPRTFEHLESRLTAITRLKRKYGQNFEEIEAFKEKAQSELSRLENLAEEMEMASGQVEKALAETDRKAKALSEKRRLSASSLAQTLTTQLQQLNMLGAEVNIEVQPQPRSQSGDDLIQFYLKANTGEHPGLVKEHSSGGELSRLLFAIKIALAEKNNTPTLIFDEIDANVGGTTATIIGEKLKELGACRQVICITHFPQVASKAETHYGVQKLEVEGRTLTEIKPLTKKQREQELLRMMGGKVLIET